MSKCVVNLEIALENNRVVIVSRQTEREREGQHVRADRSICMQIMLGHWVSWFMANNEYNYTECIRKLSSSRARSLQFADNWLRWSISYPSKRKFNKFPTLFPPLQTYIWHIQSMAICIDRYICIYKHCGARFNYERYANANDSIQ